MYQKNKRYVNKKNIELVRSLPCLVCLKQDDVDCDHIRTRGAGGGDNLGNLQSLCRQCHIIKHSIGLKEFLKRYHRILVDRRREFSLPPMQLKFFGD